MLQLRLYSTRLRRSGVSSDRYSLNKRARIECCHLFASAWGGADASGGSQIQCATTGDRDNRVPLLAVIGDEFFTRAFDLPVQRVDAYWVIGRSVNRQQPRMQMHHRIVRSQCVADQQLRRTIRNEGQIAHAPIIARADAIDLDRCQVVDRAVGALEVEPVHPVEVSSSTCSTSRQGPSGRMSSVL